MGMSSLSSGTHDWRRGRGPVMDKLMPGSRLRDDQVNHRPSPTGRMCFVYKAAEGGGSAINYFVNQESLALRSQSATCFSASSLATP